MTESKVKLQLNRNISMNDKNPKNSVPSKLLINHGKPNFIIDRSQSNNYKKFHMDTTDSGNNIKLKNDFSKVILKSISSNNSNNEIIPSPLQNHSSTFNNISVNGDGNEFLEKHKRIADNKAIVQPKSTLMNHSITSSSSSASSSSPIIENSIGGHAEFLEKHRKISDKLKLNNSNDQNGAILLPTNNYEQDLPLPIQNHSVKNLILLNENTAANEKPQPHFNNKSSPQIGQLIHNRIQNDSIVVLGKNHQIIMNEKPKIPQKPSIFRSTSNNSGTNNNADVPAKLLSRNAEQLMHEDAEIILIENSKFGGNKLSTNGQMHPNNDISKLKFDIETCNGDIVVTPIIQ